MILTYWISYFSLVGESTLIIFKKVHMFIFSQFTFT